MEDQQQLHVHAAVALKSVLDAIVAHDRAKPPAPMRVWNASDIDMEELLFGDLEELASDPIGESLRLAVDDIGERLHKAGGLKLMHDTLQSAVAADDPAADTLTDIVDKRWSGIGDWAA